MSLRTAPRQVFASLIAIAAALCTWAASAQAETVTVGSPTLSTYGGGGVQGNNGSIETLANLILAEPGAHVTSPVTGTITQWRAVIGTGHYALRVLRPAGGDEYTGAGTSPQDVATPGTYTFPANLPIQAGDLIGIDVPDVNDGGGIQAALLSGASYGNWLDTIPDGSTAAPNPIVSNTGFELAFNADVQTPNAATTPTSAKKCKKKKKHKRSAESTKKKRCKKKKKH
jgi:hypothetical protein